MASNAGNTVEQIGQGIGAFLNPLIGGTQTATQTQTTAPESDQSSSTTAFVVVALVVAALAAVYFLTGNKTPKTE